MRRLKLLAALALFTTGAFVLDGCLRRPIYRDPLPHDGFETVPEVRVGISAARDVPQLTLVGEARVADRSFSGAIEVRAEGGTVTVGGRAFPAPVRIEPDGALLRHGERSYRGAFEIHLNDGTLTLVNVVPAEDYLAGVVGKEMNLSWPQAALKAQVIAARTYVLHEINRGSLRRKGLPFDVFDDQRSQVYAGTERETSLARRMVGETGGMVLRYDDRLIKAFYSSTCGGATESAHAVLRHPRRIPPLGGTRCGHCAGTKYYRWTMTPMPISEVSRRLGRGRVLSVTPLKRLPSGRVETVRLRTDRGTVTLDANGEFRRTLDPRTIRSTLWEEVAVRDGKLHIRGRGWGHGAGMCQMGALGMARKAQVRLSMPQVASGGAHSPGTRRR